MAVRVMLVDDSALIRRLLAGVLAGDPDIEVAGQAQNGQVALDRVDDIDPDIVVLDIEMPVLDGLETLQVLKQQRPSMPVIMFSTLTERGASATLEALTRGADEYVTKPSNTGSFDKTKEEISTTLIPRIKALVERARTRPSAPPRTAARPAATSRPSGTRTPRLSRPQRKELFRPEVVVVGVSTGGPDALNRVIPRLPRDLTVPVLVTQHMPPIFTRLLAERLDEASELRVAEADAGVTPRPGEVWFAPGGKHLVITRTTGGRMRLDLDDGPPVQSCKPAADPMFDSAVKAYGGNVLAVMLTGMGSDGHHGSELVRDAGGMVICQDEATSVVWGMPGVVARAGLAEKVLPLQEIPAAIVQATRLSRESSPSLAPAARS